MRAPLRDNDVLEILRDHGGIAAAPAGMRAYLRALAFEPAAGTALVIRHPPPPRLPWMATVAELHAGLAADAFLLRADDPLASAFPTVADLSDEDRRIRDARWDRVAPLLEDSGSFLAALARGRPMRGLIAERAAELRVHEKTIYDLVIAYLVGGQCVAALAGRTRERGAPGKPRLPGSRRLGRPPTGGWEASGLGCNASQEMRDTIMREAPRLRRAGHSWTSVHQVIVERHYSVPASKGGLPYRTPDPGLAIPTSAQVVYYGRKAITPAETLQATKGRGKYKREDRGRPGTLARTAAGPGAVYVVDATLNTWLRSRRPEHRGKIIGRAVLYLVFDLYSHVCAAIHVALRPPSWRVALRALLCAMTPKEALFSELGLPFRAEEHPCFHKPGALMSDRGPEWTGLMVAHAAGGLGIKRCLLEPYRPDLNGLAESGHQRLKDEAARYAPGVWQRPERGVRQKIEAVYDVTDMRKVAATWMRHHNVGHELRREHAPPGLSLLPDGTRPKPADAFIHGVVRCGRPQVVEEALVLRHLLPRTTATVSDRGFRINGLRYVAMGVVDDPRLARNTRAGPLELRAAYDPEDAGVAYLVQGRGRFERLALTPGDQDYNGWSLDEVEHDLALNSIAERKGLPSRLAMASQRRAEFRQINAEAREKSPEKATWTGRADAHAARLLDASDDGPCAAVEARQGPTPSRMPAQRGSAAAPGQADAPPREPLRPSYGTLVAAAREAELPKRR